MQDLSQENQYLNQNLMEKQTPNQTNQIPSYDNTNSINNYNSNVIYQNQPGLLNDQISSQLSFNDKIKIEYEKAILSDFEKILQYDSLSNQFKRGLDEHLAYPYHFNPVLTTLTRYYKSCECCGGSNNLNCCDFIFQNSICQKIKFAFALFFTVKSIYAFLSIINLAVFINALKMFFSQPTTFLYVLFVYGLTLFFEYQLLYYKLPQPLNPDEFKKKIQQKIQTAQRIYFGDDKKVVPLVYNCYRDISGTLELTKPFNLVIFYGRPGTYFLDGRTIKEFYKLDQEFGIRGGNQKYYINYENSPMNLNSKLDYEAQTLNSMFTAHERNELFMQEDELLYIAPQGFKKWDTIPLICFLCLVGFVYNNYFELNLEFKSYKIRKALFFEEPDKEVEEKLEKYSPKIIYQGNNMEFEQHSERIDQNLIKPYYDKWDENYIDKNMKNYI